MSVNCVETLPTAALRAVSCWLSRASKAARAHGERYAAYRQTLRELNACSDRELSDMGISRFDVRRLAREAAALAR